MAMCCFEEAEDHLLQYVVTDAEKEAADRYKNRLRDDGLIWGKYGQTCGTDLITPKRYVFGWV